MMRAGGGNFQSTTCLQLSADIGEIQIENRFVDRGFWNGQRQRLHAVDMRDHIEQAACDIGFDIAGKRDFIAVGSRNDQCASGFRGRECRRQHAIDFT